MFSFWNKKKWKNKKNNIISKIKFLNNIKNNSIFLYYILLFLLIVFILFFLILLIIVIISAFFYNSMFTTLVSIKLDTNFWFVSYNYRNKSSNDFSIKKYKYDNLWDNKLFRDINTIWKNHIENLSWVQNQLTWNIKQKIYDKLWIAWTILKYAEKSKETEFTYKNTLNYIDQFLILYYLNDSYVYLSDINNLWYDIVKQNYFIEEISKLKNKNDINSKNEIRYYEWEAEKLNKNINKILNKNVSWKNILLKYKNSLKEYIKKWCNYFWISDEKSCKKFVLKDQRAKTYSIEELYNAISLKILIKMLNFVDANMINNIWDSYTIKKYLIYWVNENLKYNFDYKNIISDKVWYEKYKKFVDIFKDLNKRSNFFYYNFINTNQFMFKKSLFSYEKDFNVAHTYLDSYNKTFFKKLSPNLFIKYIIWINKQTENYWDWSFFWIFRYVKNKVFNSKLINLKWKSNLFIKEFLLEKEWKVWTSQTLLNDIKFKYQTLIDSLNIDKSKNSDLNKIIKTDLKNEKELLSNYMKNEFLKNKLILEYQKLIDIINWLNKIKIIRSFISWNYKDISLSPLNNLYYNEYLDKISIFFPFLWKTKVTVEKNDFNIANIINWTILWLNNDENDENLIDKLMSNADIDKITDEEFNYAKSKIKKDFKNILNRNHHYIKVDVTNYIKNIFNLRKIHTKSWRIYIYIITDNLNTNKNFSLSINKFWDIHDIYQEYYMLYEKYKISKPELAKRYLENWKMNKQVFSELKSEYKKWVEKEIQNRLINFLNKFKKAYAKSIEFNEKIKENIKNKELTNAKKITFCNISKLINIRENFSLFNLRLDQLLIKQWVNLPLYYQTNKQYQVCITISNIYLKKSFYDQLVNPIVDPWLKSNNLTNKIKAIIKWKFNSIWYWNLINVKIKLIPILKNNDASKKEALLNNTLSNLRKYSINNLQIKYYIDFWLNNEKKWLYKFYKQSKNNIIYKWPFWIKKTLLDYFGVFKRNYLWKLFDMCKNWEEEWEKCKNDFVLRFKYWKNLNWYWIWVNVNYNLQYKIDNTLINNIKKTDIDIFRNETNKEKQILYNWENKSLSFSNIFENLNIWWSYSENNYNIQDWIELIPTNINIDLKKDKLIKKNKKDVQAFNNLINVIKNKFLNQHPIIFSSFIQKNNNKLINENYFLLNNKLRKIFNLWLINFNNQIFIHYNLDYNNLFNLKSNNWLNFNFSNWSFVGFINNLIKRINKIKYYWWDYNIFLLNYQKSSVLKYYYGNLYKNFTNWFFNNLNNETIWWKINTNSLTIPILYNFLFQINNFNLWSNNQTRLNTIYNIWDVLPTNITTKENKFKNNLNKILNILSSSNVIKNKYNYPIYSSFLKLFYSDYNLTSLNYWKLFFKNLLWINNNNYFDNIIINSENYKLAKEKFYNNFIDKNYWSNLLNEKYKLQNKIIEELWKKYWLNKYQIELFKKIFEKKYLYKYLNWFENLNIQWLKYFNNEIFLFNQLNWNFNNIKNPNLNLTKLFNIYKTIDFQLNSKNFYDSSDTFKNFQDLNRTYNNKEWTKWYENTLEDNYTYFRNDQYWNYIDELEKIIKINNKILNNEKLTEKDKTFMNWLKNNPEVLKFLWINNKNKYKFFYFRNWTTKNNWFDLWWFSDKKTNQLKYKLFEDKYNKWKTEINSWNVILSLCNKKWYLKIFKSFLNNSNISWWLFNLNGWQLLEFWWIEHLKSVNINNLSYKKNWNKYINLCINMLAWTILMNKILDNWIDWNKYFKKEIDNYKRLLSYTDYINQYIKYKNLIKDNKIILNNENFDNIKNTKNYLNLNWDKYYINWLITFIKTNKKNNKTDAIKFKMETKSYSLLSNLDHLFQKHKESFFIDKLDKIYNKNNFYLTLMNSWLKKFVFEINNLGKNETNTFNNSLFSNYNVWNSDLQTELTNYFLYILSNQKINPNDNFKIWINNFKNIINNLFEYSNWKITFWIKANNFVDNYIKNYLINFQPWVYYIFKSMNNKNNNDIKRIFSYYYFKNISTNNFELIFWIKKSKMKKYFNDQIKQIKNNIISNINKKYKEIFFYLLNQNEKNNYWSWNILSIWDLYKNLDYKNLFNKNNSNDNFYSKKILFKLIKKLKYTNYNYTWFNNFVNNYKWNIFNSSEINNKINKKFKKISTDVWKILINWKFRIKPAYLMQMKSEKIKNLWFKLFLQNRINSKKDYLFSFYWDWIYTYLNTKKSFTWDYLKWFNIYSQEKNSLTKRILIRDELNEIYNFLFILRNSYNYFLLELKNWNWKFSNDDGIEKASLWYWTEISQEELYKKLNSNKRYWLILYFNFLKVRFLENKNYEWFPNYVIQNSKLLLFYLKSYLKILRDFWSDWSFFNSNNQNDLINYYFWNEKLITKLSNLILLKIWNYYNWIYNEQLNKKENFYWLLKNKNLEQIWLSNLSIYYLNNIEYLNYLSPYEIYKENKKVKLLLNSKIKNVFSNKYNVVDNSNKVKLESFWNQLMWDLWWKSTFDFRFWKTIWYIKEKTNKFLNYFKSKKLTQNEIDAKIFLDTIKEIYFRSILENKEVLQENVNDFYIKNVLVNYENYKKINDTFDNNNYKIFYNWEVNIQDILKYKKDRVLNLLKNYYDFNEKLKVKNFYLYNFIIWQNIYYNTFDIPVKTDLIVLNKDKPDILAFNLISYLKNKSSIFQSLEIYNTIKAWVFDSIDTNNIERINFKLFKDVVKKYVKCWEKINSKLTWNNINSWNNFNYNYQTCIDIKNKILNTNNWMEFRKTINKIYTSNDNQLINQSKYKKELKEILSKLSYYWYLNLIDVKNWQRTRKFFREVFPDICNTKEKCLSWPTHRYPTLKLLGKELWAVWQCVYWAQLFWVYFNKFKAWYSWNANTLYKSANDWKNYFMWKWEYKWVKYNKRNPLKFQIWEIPKVNSRWIRTRWEYWHIMYVLKISKNWKEVYVMEMNWNWAMLIHWWNDPYKWNNIYTNKNMLKITFERLPVYKFDRFVYLNEPIKSY